ncbi:hypothetical protein ANO14919_059510 [Xylariales sp. No.14919]|nr:hypothetical protein ANO14919_059510 [Xylariales sp. No.14919]
MDPGTAVGVVSLALQVSQGLLDYYRAWEGYSDDVRQAYNCIADLNKTFALLDNRLRSMQTVNPGSNIVNRVVECLTACTDEVQHLERKLKKLHKQNPNGFAQKAQASVLRASYPFRASTLEKLKEIVQELMGHLKLAIQVLLLENGVERGEVMTRIEDSVGDIRNLVTKIHTTALDTQIQTGVAAAGVEVLLKAEEIERRRQVLRALDAPNPSIEHNEARRKHEPGTGEWFLKCQSYQDWVTGLSPRLWVHGKAGCCKTVLCSTIIEDVKRQLLNNPGAVLAYFYFSFSDAQKQSYANLLLALVTELSRGCAIHPKLLAAYNNTPERKPDTSVLEEVLIDLLRGSRTPYLIIDALDECPESGNQREQVMQGLEKIAKEGTDTRLLVTSRKDPDIEEFMQTLSVVQMAVDEESVNADIDIFVRNTLATDKKLSIKIKEEIEQMFHEKSDGMFRWAALQLQSIRSLKILRPSYISAALREMPRSLDETYQRILDAIDEMYHDEVRVALEWLVFSERPLSVAELGEACSIRLDGNNKPFLEECSDEIVSGILGVLSPLVIVELVPDTDRTMGVNPLPMKFSSERYIQRIRLAHFSVKEYLMSSRLRAPRASKFMLGSNGHHDLAQMCCAYVLYFTSQGDVGKWIEKAKQPLSSDSGDRRRIRENLLQDLTPSYPLLSYAIHRWTRHQGLAERETNAPPMDVNLHLQILQDERVRITWLSFVGSIIDCGSGCPASWRFCGDLYDQQEGTKAIYWTSLLGFYHTTSMLCEQAPCSDINHVAGYHETALQAAAEFNAVKIAGKLIEAGADVNIMAGRPLMVASMHGNKKIIQILLDNGAIINAPRKSNTNALIAASRWHRFDAVELLIDRGADLMIADSDGYTPLHKACLKYGSVDVVKLLLDKGADPNIVANEGSTPLHWASEHGSVDVVKLLLDKGADPTAVANEGSTPLHWASEHGSVDVVKLLLDKGADPNIVTNKGSTPLLLGSEGNHVDVVKLLLEKDADPTAVANEGSTPLHWASKHGSVHVVKLLLDKEVEVKADIRGWTPLHWASRYNHVDVVKLLLEKVDHASIADYAGRSPLFYAIMKGQNGVFDVLRAGQQSKMRDYFGISALSIAVRCGRERIVDQLLATLDTDINSGDNCGRTPIWWALKQGHVEIANRLRQHLSGLGLDASVAGMEMGAPVLFNVEGRYCDVCLAGMNKRYYSCDHCSGGDFDVCRECYELGGHCLVKSHILTPCEVSEDEGADDL